MRSSKRAVSTIALAALVALVTGFAGCGNGKEDRSLLTANRAGQLRSTLDDVERMIDDGDCEGATNTVLAFEQKVNALPARIDASLRDALSSGASRLQRLVASQCKPVAPTGPTGPTVQVPAQNDEGGQGKKGKGKAKGHDKNKKDENPDEGTTGPTVPDENLGITTP
jgi:hypothetical protein